MMKMSALTAALLLAAGPAFAAVSVTNQSDKAHEITADHGDKEPKMTIEPGKRASVDCPSGCELRVTGMGYGLPAKPGDAVVIGKDGMLAFEGAERQASNEDGKKKTMVD